ncbi:unnamed protein product [Lymnaea stagnalis]|uniref:Uncharacterized protein n=1 Tax=Lymnaea stagnalis TaxID=6523 RepID=A0AAV2IFJ7_LYMST
MVFRAQKEINKSFYDVFLANGSHNDNPLSDEFPIECYRLDNLGNCNQHFRSYILDNWINIDKVKFAFYTEGVEMKSIEFDGKSSTWSSWFNQSAILTSSWTNIKTDLIINHFTLPGNTAYGIARRFTIEGSYAGCDTDVTYMFTIDTNWDVCSGYWNFTITKFPLFIYASGNTMVRLSGTLPDLQTFWPYL